MSLAASREKLRIMVSKEESGQRLSAVRVLPGGELVAVEEKRRSNASQPFRREASALWPEIGNSQRLLRDFELERLREPPQTAGAFPYKNFADATQGSSLAQSMGRSFSTTTLSLMDGRASPIIGYEDMQATAFANATTSRASTPYNLNDAAGLRITKRRPPSSGGC